MFEDLDLKIGDLIEEPKIFNTSPASTCRAACSETNKKYCC